MPNLKSNVYILKWNFLSDSISADYITGMMLEKELDIDDYVLYKDIILWHKEWEHVAPKHIVKRDLKTATLYIDLITNPLYVAVNGKFKWDSGYTNYPF